MKIISGIYQIINIVNNHSYIGSSKNIIKRWYRHRQQLKKNKHHSLYLQRAWNKYGSNSFTLKIILETDDLLKNELEFIKLIKPEYNVGVVGGGDNISNHPNLEHIKNKHRENYYKNVNGLKSYSKARFGSSNPNWKGGISSPKCLTCNTNISYGHIYCVICSKQGNKNPFYNHQHSQEAKLQISKNKKGKKPSNSKLIIIDGVTYLSQSDAAKSLGISSALITYRIKKGLYG